MNIYARIAIFLVLAFTFCSAALTGSFGYEIGEADGWLRNIYAAVGVLISVAVALFSFLTGYLLYRKAWVAATVSVLVAAVFIFGDVMGNFGMAAYSREGSSLLARNTNTAVQYRQRQIDELRKNIQRARDSDLFKANLRTAGAYRTHKSQIENRVVAGGGRNIFQRSKGCTNVTLPESEKLCFEWNAAREGIANAEEKERLEASIRAWETKLTNVEAEVIAQPKTIAAAAAQSFNFARIFNQTLKPGEDAATWADMGMSGYMGFISTFGAIFCSIAAGWLGVRPDYRTIDQPRQRVRPQPVYVEDTRDDDLRHFHEVAARAQDPNSTNNVTVVSSGDNVRVTDTLKQAMAIAEAALDRHHENRSAHA